MAEIPTKTAGDEDLVAKAVPEAEDISPEAAKAMEEVKANEEKELTIAFTPKNIQKYDMVLVVNLIGIGDDDLTVDDAEQISCDACQGGYPVSQMFNYNPQNPQNGGCPQGWIPSGTGDPCEGQGTGCDFNPNGGCAQLHDLQGRFVNNNPSNFLSNMYNGYQNNGCNFLYNRLAHH